MPFIGARVPAGVAKSRDMMLSSAAEATSASLTLQTLHAPLVSSAISRRSLFVRFVLAKL